MWGWGQHYKSCSSFYLGGISKLVQFFNTFYGQIGGLQLPTLASLGLVYLVSVTTLYTSIAKPKTFALKLSKLFVSWIDKLLSLQSDKILMLVSERFNYL